MVGKPRFGVDPVFPTIIAESLRNRGNSNRSSPRIRVTRFPRFRSRTHQVVESDDATELVFTVNLSRASDTPVSVRYATTDGTAVAGSDFEAAAGTITFAPGETEREIRIAVTGDRTVEPDEDDGSRPSPTPTERAIRDGRRRWDDTRRRHAADREYPQRNRRRGGLRNDRCRIPRRAFPQSQAGRDGDGQLFYRRRHGRRRRFRGRVPAC